MTAAERSHIRRLGPVQQVAGGEDAGPRRSQRRVHGRATGARVHREPSHHCELVVGDPVGAEDDGVARDAAYDTAVQIGELHLLHSRSSVDRAEHGASPERSPEAQGGARPEQRQRLVPR